MSRWMDLDGINVCFCLSTTIQGTFSKWHVVRDQCSRVLVEILWIKSRGMKRQTNMLVELHNSYLGKAVHRHAKSVGELPTPVHGIQATLEEGSGLATGTKIRRPMSNRLFL